MRERAMVGVRRADPKDGDYVRQVVRLRAYPAHIIEAARSAAAE